RQLTITFFFQAEDGIRDFHVTGVQTCALPIYIVAHLQARFAGRPFVTIGNQPPHLSQVVGSNLAALSAVLSDDGRQVTVMCAIRSEERRVGKEWLCWWARSPWKKA